MESEPRAARSAQRLPTFFIPHGGGPCFFMTGPMARAWDSLAAFLRHVRSTLPTQPAAIVVVSAHWEEPRPTVTSRLDPPLIFDYYGFPPETYALRYDVPGSPSIARRATELLEAAGLPAGADAARGLDHGVFVPFLLLAPQAQIPIVELSLVAGLDPAQHLAIGAALAPLRDEGVLIVGSGMSYHNMRGFSFSGSSEAVGSTRFDAWLSQTALAEPVARTAGLTGWQHAPDARLAHPREEHLLPLMVAAGAAAGDRGTHVFHDRIVGAMISAYRFG
jgi:aromatic ring-opening dioxygenase catalytic subunit (LigB family)